MWSLTISRIWDQPRIMDGTVQSIVSHGNSVYVGGTFTTIRNYPADASNISQAYLFKFNVATGLIDQSFRPTLNGDVEGLALSSDGSSIFVGGGFTTINGQSRERLAKLNTSNGSVNQTFVANANNEVLDIALSDHGLIAGGRFRYVNDVNRERLVAVNPTTGAVVNSFDIPVTVGRFYSPYVAELEVSPDGDWLVITGNFKDVDGFERVLAAVITLSGSSPSVANWASDRFTCTIRGLDISPDSSWFVINTTGSYQGPDELCDTTSRWEFPPAMTGTGLEPTWENHTGGDTVWAAEITESVIYVGGHQRWENNPYPSPGGDDDGPGSVERPGIAALDPLSGVPLSWNPGRDRGRGVEAFLATDDYLFVGSDTVLFADVVRQRLAVLPVAGGTPNPDPDHIKLPVTIHAAMPDGRLDRFAYDGTSFGAVETISGPGVDGINWTTVRDGFAQLGKLVYFGQSDAYFRRSFNGSVFGSPTNLSTSVGYVDNDRNLTPYDQPYGVAEVVDAAYADGRIYYTKNDDSRLWWRWYSLESGIIGGFEFIASSANWNGATAIDVIGDWVYAAWADGKLYRMPVSGDTVNYGAREVVDAGAAGVNWASVGALFSLQGSGSVPPPGPDATPPNGLVDVPSSSQVLDGPSVTLSGTASDNVGVDAAWIAIRDRSTGMWLQANGTTFASAYTLIPAALASQGAKNTPWSLGVSLNDGSYAVQLKVDDAAGNRDPSPPWIPFSVASDTPDTSDPNGVVDLPASGAVLSGPDVVLSGTATDDVAVGAAWVAIRDRSSGQWLQSNGTSFGGTYTLLPATIASPGATTTGWTFPVSLASGSYGIQLKVDDAAGNRDPSPPWVPFSVTSDSPDASAPSGTVDIPAAGADLAGPDLVLTGTATDDVGVDAAWVAIRDRATGFWLQADAASFGSAYTLLPATLGSPGAGNTGWTFPVSLASGSYGIQLKVDDAAGNRDASPPWVNFTVSTS